MLSLYHKNLIATIYIYEQNAKMRVDFLTFKQVIPYKVKNKKLKRILLVGTGALLSPLSTLQKQSIPVIAHAVAIESEGN